MLSISDSNSILKLESREKNGKVLSRWEKVETNVINLNKKRSKLIYTRGY